MQARNRALVERKEQEERQRSAAQREVIADVCQRNQTFSYDDIGYLNAVIAFSTMLASDEACEHGTFQQSDGIHLCASAALCAELLGRLFNAGILGLQRTTPWQAIELGTGDSWSYYPHRVHWKVAQDLDDRSYPAVMALLGEIIDEREDDPEYGQAVAELWRLLAYDDAVNNLTQEVDNYRLPYLGN